MPFRSVRVRHHSKVLFMVVQPSRICSLIVALSAGSEYAVDKPFLAGLSSFSSSKTPGCLYIFGSLRYVFLSQHHFYLSSWISVYEILLPCLLLLSILHNYLDVSVEESLLKYYLLLFPVSSYGFIYCSHFVASGISFMLFHKCFINRRSCS